MTKRWKAIPRVNVKRRRDALFALSLMGILIMPRGRILRFVASQAAIYRAFE